jgi:hypothetical protein
LADSVLTQHASRYYLSAGRPDFAMARNCTGDYYDGDVYDDRMDEPANGALDQEDESVEGLGMIFFK